MFDDKCSVVRTLNNQIIIQNKAIEESGKSIEVLKQRCEQYSKELKSIESTIREQEKDILTQCRDSLEATAGIMAKSVYIAKKSEDKYGFTMLEKLTHNSRKMVVLYNESEIENGNYSRSLMQYFYQIIQLFLIPNNFRVFGSKIRLIDFESNGDGFVNDSKFDVYNNGRPMTEFYRILKQQENLIDSKMQNIGQNNSDIFDIEEVNRYELKEFLHMKELYGSSMAGAGFRNIPYYLTFIILGAQTERAFTQEIWSDFVRCENYGVMPVFFISEERWKRMNENEHPKKCVPVENIFYIDKEGIRKY